MHLLDYALEVARESAASLILLHVISKQPYDNGTFEPDTAIHQQLCHEANIILQQLSRHTIVHGIRSKVMVTSGTAAAKIIEIAKNLQASMIVLSRSCGQPGGTTENVLRSAHCPVLTWEDEYDSKESWEGAAEEESAACLSPALA